MSLYVQQEGCYPGSSYLQTVFQPYISAPLLEPNYNYNGIGYRSPPQSVYVCPAYNRLHGEVGPDLTSYGYNNYGTGSWQTTPPSATWLGLTAPAMVVGPTNDMGILVKEGWVVMPSDMIAIGDAPLTEDKTVGAVTASWFLGQPFFYASWYNQTMRGSPTSDLGVQGMSKRHGGKWNIAFCDGHIENLRASQIFDVSNSAVAQRWNRDHQAHNETWVAPPSP
jgi:prepilin-type processing-associated H-X9-DG protein